jgi:hypothetical protein
VLESQEPAKTLEDILFVCRNLNWSLFSVCVVCS